MNSFLFKTRIDFTLDFEKMKQLSDELNNLNSYMHNIFASEMKHNII